MEWADHNSGEWENRCLEHEPEKFRDEFDRVTQENVDRNKLKANVDFDQINDALDCIVTEKTEGNAALKATPVDQVKV